MNRTNKYVSILDQNGSYLVKVINKKQHSTLHIEVHPDYGKALMAAKYLSVEHNAPIKKNDK